MPKASVSSALPGRPPKRHRVVLSQVVTLRLDDGRVFEVSPNVIQTARVEWYGIADTEGLFDYGVTHRFDVVLERELFKIPRNDPDPDETWQSLRTAFKVKRVRPRPKDFRDSPGEIWLAYLEVAELPSHIVNQASFWADACDMMGDTLRWGIDIVDNISEGFDVWHEQALVEGALIWPRVLGVHPRARGQDLGIRLLAHALWALHRSSDDVAILEAAAISTYFDGKAKVEQTPASFRALCRYYGRLGFRRWFVKQRAESKGGSIMVLRLGEVGIRAFYESGKRLL